MTLPDDIELRDEVKRHILTAALWREHVGASNGTEYLDTDRAKLNRDEGSNRVTDLIMEVIATYRKKWEAEADRATIETLYSILNGDDNQVETAKAYIWNKLQALQGENK